MASFNFYSPLLKTDENEQDKLGSLQDDLYASLTEANNSQNTLINNYMQVKSNVKKCKKTCALGDMKDTASWKASIEKDGSETQAGASMGLKDAVESCKAGCDLLWRGQFDVDSAQKIGIFNDPITGEKQTIQECDELSKFASKVKLGGRCDANDECATGTCVTWGKRCATKGEDPNSITGRCGITAERVNGTWSWGTKFISLCKQDVDSLGLKKWKGVTQYIQFQGEWVKIKDYGYPSASQLPNQRLENGKYIQDVQTAIKAAQAYGKRVKAFIQNNDGFILQDSGTGITKPSWSQFSSELLSLNGTKEGFTSDVAQNKKIAGDPTKIISGGNVLKSMMAKGIQNKSINASSYENPTFPIAAMEDIMDKTCPKGWKKTRNGQSCAIFNDDIKSGGTSDGAKIGWDGSSFGCNLPNTDKYYQTDCEDVPNKTYSCWSVGKFRTDMGCKTIKGKDIPSCYASGGRPREAECPPASKMILWITRPNGPSYIWRKHDLLPILQEIATEFPDVRIIDKKEMQNIVDKNIGFCACGWYRSDVFSGTTWRNGNNNFSGIGLERIPLVIGWPSNTTSGSGCGDNKQVIRSCSTSFNGWNNGGRAGMYITLTAVQDFVVQKLRGMGFRSGIVMTNAQMRRNPSILESFVGAMSLKEGMSPMEKDMVSSCKDAKKTSTIHGVDINPTGDFLVKNRSDEKAAFQKLNTSANNVLSKIKDLQSDRMKVSDEYKLQNTMLLKKLAGYQKSSAELLKSGFDLDTLGGLSEDVMLKKGSSNLSYLIWLTLAISVLGIAITRIR